jgi:hypothetical protein
MVYLSKVNLMVGTPRGEEQRRSNEAKLKQAEHKFGQAIFLSNNYLSVSNGSPWLSSIVSLGDIVLI